MKFNSYFALHVVDECESSQMCNQSVYVFSWPPAAWHDAGPSHGWTANDANDGPTPTRDDAGWTR